MKCFTLHTCILMITLFSNNYNPLTQQKYDDIINHLQFHQLQCSCGHSGCLTIHGYYTRHLKTPDGMISLRICRVYCSECHKTHALLLSSIVPYSQIPCPVQYDIIKCFYSRSSYSSVLASNPFIDENNIKSVIRSFIHCWKERLASEDLLLHPLELLISKCFSIFHRQFMQIKSTSNILHVRTT